MAHYAFLNNNNIVTEVIVGNEETTGDWEAYYSKVRGQTCIRTSYNAKIRKNYAGIGFTYDKKLDAFIPPKPFDSWKLVKKTCLWAPPVAMPIDEFSYAWDEASKTWTKIVE